MIFYRKAKTYIDGMWAIASVIYVPVLIAINMCWYVGLGSNAWATSSTVTERVSPGVRTKINADVIMNVKGIYKLRLVDSTGATVCIYPTHDLNNVAIQVPHIKGEYKLIAEIDYAQNPIKTGRFVLKLANLTVD